MEPIEDNQEILSSQEPENQPINKNTHNNKNKFFLIAEIATLILIAAIITLYLYAQKSSPLTQTPQAITISEISPTLLPSPSSESFIPYSQIKKNNLNEDMVVFSDNVLKISFSYPKKYFSQSFKADEENLYAGLFFLKERDSEKEKNIKYFIDCELDNRIDPAGICRESIVGDLEVSINPANKIPDYDEDKNSTYKQCEKETISGNKVIYSCSAQLSIDSKDKGMIYSLYLTKDSPKVIRISTRNPEHFADLITSIINSANIQ